ncbi:IS5/IS1182 family transposase, partial [Francisella tularensis subsp. holarctica]|nr:IS5/IS1182 family transposase [Francisella tularensis subsp. holarctica]
YKIKHFRRVFSRFDKTMSEYIGMIKLSCTFIWLLRNYLCAQNLINIVFKQLSIFSIK